MQLKLLPPHPLPTVLFTLSYPAPPSNLPLPASYAHFLKLIVEENLLDSDNNILERVDGPLSLHRQSGVGVAAGVGGTGQGSLTPHALDKATWISAVLSEVVFDLSGCRENTNNAVESSASSPIDLSENLDASKETVRDKKVRVVCRYVDGREVEWTWIVPSPSATDIQPSTSDANDDARACYAALQSVLRDVTESATAGERERKDRERRHTYHERHAFEATYPFSAGSAERYTRYPVPVLPKVPLQRRASVAIQRSYSVDEPRALVEDGEERRRKSLDGEEMGRDAEMHIPGFVETRRGKSRRNRGGVRKDESREEKDEKDKDVKEGKGKHKKQRSLWMSLTAFASSITSRSRTPPPSPNASQQTTPDLLQAPIVPSQAPSRATSPIPHTVHPQLSITSIQPYEPIMSSSDLRRRARATLVDVFRRYVLSELKTFAALPPRMPRAKSLRRVQSLTESDAGAASPGRLRSASSALTTRSSNFSLSEASMRVQCISRSPSVTVLKSYESTVGVYRGRFDENEEDDDCDDDLDEDEVEFGKCNEGGYVTWVTRSLLQRVEVEMREMRIVVRSMNARASRRSIRINVGGIAMQRNVGNRMGLSPVDGLLLSSMSVSGAMNELDGSAALVDETLPFCDDFDDSFGSEHAKVVDDDLEDVPLDDNLGEDAETISTGTATSTETDSSSIHTPSELTSFDQAEVLSPATPPLDSPARGEYFSRVGGSAAEAAMDFEPPSLSSSPPRRRPVLTKQPSHLSRPVPPSLPSQPLPRSPSPPFRPSHSLSISPPHSPTSPTSSALPLAAYTALSSERLRLLAILTRLSSQHANAKADERQVMKVLEIKSMRRAWSNCAFMGGASVRFVGLSTPDRKSPLSTAKPITATDLRKGLFQVGREHLEGVEGVRGTKRGLVVTTAESNIMRLFPVCEEDEDSDSEGLEDVAFRASFDSSSSSGGGDASFGRGQNDDTALSDTEDGLLANLDFPPLTRQPNRRCSVPVRPRARTKSMNMSSSSAPSASPLLPVPVTMGGPSSTPFVPMSSSYPGSYPSTDQTFIPPPYMRPSRSTDNLLGVDANLDMMEYGMLEPQTKVELFDVYSGDEDDDDETGDEFTLSMDLPAPCIAARHGTSFNARKRRECGSDGWFPS